MNPFSAHLRRGILLSIFLVSVLIPVAHAQQADDPGLAPSMARALTKAKVTTVVVFDFMGSDEKLTQLGQDLADAFSNRLANSGGEFNVIDRPQVRAVIEKNRVAPDVIRDPEIAWWFARQLNADALIVGDLTPLNGDTLKIAIAAARVKDGKDIDSMSVRVSFTDEMKTLLSKSLSVDHMKDRIDPTTPKELVPKCVYCPRAEFSSAALDKKKEGIVLLIVQITQDGIAKDIEFVQGAQYGLTQKAIEAVQGWKFEPAQTTDGKPRAVWQQIQVTFHLY